jgi:hypothetical protein
MKANVISEVHAPEFSGAHFQMQAALVAFSVSTAHTPAGRPCGARGMATKPRRRSGRDQRKPWELEDIRRLKALWENRPKHLTQVMVAQEVGADRSVVSQHMRGDTALTWKWVLAYAKALGVQPADISPTLAKENMLAIPYLPPEQSEGSTPHPKEPSNLGKLPSSSEDTSTPVVAGAKWDELPPTVRALIETVISKSSSGELADADITLVLSTISRLSSKE